MKTGLIKSEWLQMSETKRLDAEFWIRVLEQAAARKVNTNDDAAMRKLINELESAVSE